MREIEKEVKAFCVGHSFASRPIYIREGLLNPCSICSYDPANNSRCYLGYVSMRKLVLEVVKKEED